MRAWGVVVLGLVVFVGAVGLALRGFHLPAPVPGSKVDPPRAEPGLSQVEAAGARQAALPAGSTEGPGSGRRVTTCVAGATVTYTDRPCPAGSVSRTVVVAEPNTYEAIAAPEVDMGRYVAPSQGPPEMTRANSDGTFSPSRASSECRSIEAMIRTVDERARQGYTAQEGMRLNEERRHLRERYRSLNCCTTC